MFHREPTIFLQQNKITISTLYSCTWKEHG